MAAIEACGRYVGAAVSHPQPEIDVVGGPSHFSFVQSAAVSACVGLFLALFGEYAGGASHLRSQSSAIVGAFGGGCRLGHHSN